MTEHRAISLLEIKSVDSDLGLIKGIASTPKTDRVGDIVEPNGAKFTLPLPLLWQHKAEEPIGTVTEAHVTPNGIEITAKIAKGITPRIDEAWALIKAGLVRGLSIGFKSSEREPLKGGGYRFMAWDWFELSAVTIPANADASITMLKSIDDQQLRAASGAVSNGFLTTVDVRRSEADQVAKVFSTSPGATGKPLTFSHKGTGMNTSIAEQISIHEAERTFKIKQIDDLLGDGRVLNDDEQKQYDDLTNEAERSEKQIDNLRRREKLMLTATAARGTNPDEASESRENAGRPTSVTFSKSNLPAGTGFTRLCMAMMAGKGSESDTERYIQRHFRDTPQVAMAYKAAVAAGTTTDANWAAPLVNYTDLASEFVELLRPQTIIGRLTQLRRVPFNVRFAKLASGATAQWVGQGLAKPVSALDFDTITFPFYKLATIVVLTEELVRFSSPSAEAACRQEIVSAVAQKMDTSFIDPSVAAVANVSPASITNGITAVANPGTSVTTITAALTSVLSTVATNNVNLSTGVWIMRPQTAVYLSTLRTTQDVLAFPGMALTGGNLLGFPVVVSGNMSSDTGSSSFIVFVVQDEIFIADDGATRVDASREASLQMDSAPSAGAQSLVSLWQNNLVGLRAERFANWARRRDTAVGVIEDVSF